MQHQITISSKSHTFFIPIKKTLNLPLTLTIHTYDDLPLNT